MGLLDGLFNNVFGSKEEALEALEQYRAGYLASARQVARELVAKSPDGTVTVNDVRAVCPPPENIDGRVMGAIFRGGEWEMVGYTPSLRAHMRPIARFRLK